MKEPDFDGQLAIKGSPGSPYTKKMLAVLRYRQIPYRYLHTHIQAQYNLPLLKFHSSQLYIGLAWMESWKQ